jgi:hypothetical protein
MRVCSALVTTLVFLMGCGSGNQFARVSGRVTLNGKPLANATVSFQPISPENSSIAAPGSTGKTNEKGEFTLIGLNGEPGAWVGKHRVVITLLAPEVGESDERPPRGGWPQKEQVPEKYNNKSKETFDVPPEGTTSADFVLKSTTSGLGGSQYSESKTSSNPKK